MKIVWIIANCNSQTEAVTIGKTVLKKRWVACFDVVPRSATGFFWPPRKGKMVSGKGTMLLLTTLPRHVHRTILLIKKIHSDQTPFISALHLDHVQADYYHWLTRELVGHE